ncbi:MAG: glycosyltransferase [Bacteroidales bacterium]|nr:glycosyltransferase [Bacteroidales bacterium]
MSARQDTISVVIAAYNRGPKIADTLNSVLSQSTQANEILVVDDGSTDDTVPFIREYYPQVRLVEAKHGGQSAARNRGAQKASSDTIIFLDSDDLMRPNAIKTILELIRRFPEAHAVFTDHGYVNHQSGATLDNHHSQLPQFSRFGLVAPVRSDELGRVYDRRLYYQLLRGNILQQPWTTRRSSFLRLGGFSEDLRNNEDWDLYLRIAYTYPVVVSDCVLSTHVVESERDHVHLSAGQDEMNMLILQRHSKARCWANLWAQVPIRQKLGLYYKAFGDQECAKGNLALATREYFRSFRQWPFDRVVVARLLMWSLRLLGPQHYANR